MWLTVNVQLGLFDGRNTDSIVGDAAVAARVRPVHTDDLQRSIRLDLVLTHVVFNLHQSINPSITIQLVVYCTTARWRTVWSLRDPERNC